jgi:hypothetical protein
VRQSRLDMVGITKGLATSSGWSLVLCDNAVIAGTGYIKSANDDSLARDEGGCHNLFMEVATYNTVQGCPIAHGTGDGNIFSRLRMQLC